MLGTNLLHPHLVPCKVIDGCPHTRAIVRGLHGTATSVATTGGAGHSIARFGSGRLTAIGPSIEFNHAHTAPRLTGRVSRFTSNAFNRNLPLGELLGLHSRTSTLPYNIGIGIIRSRAITDGGLRLELTLGRLPIRLKHSENSSGVHVTGHFDGLPTAAVTECTCPLRKSGLLRPLRVVESNVTGEVHVNSDCARAARILPRSSAFRVHSTQTVPAYHHGQQHAPQPSSCRPSSQQYAGQRQRQQRWSK